MAVAKKTTETAPAKPADKPVAAPVEKPTFSDTPAPSPILDFDELFATATIEKRRTGMKDRFLAADQIPEKYTELAKKLHDEKSRIKLPVTDDVKFAQIKNLFASAAHHLGFSSNAAAMYEGKGDAAKLIGVSITVSDERGSKKKVSAQNPADTTAENTGDENPVAGE